MDGIAREVRIQPVPKIQLRSEQSATGPEKRTIQGYIRSLAETDKPGVGYSTTLVGAAFAPIPDHLLQGAFLLGAHDIAVSRPLRDLVSLGGKAIPFLLESLSEQTPTRLQFVPHMNFIFFIEESSVLWNPYNPREKSVWSPYKLPDDDHRRREVKSYRLTVGDLCYVALGQIVGRVYSAVCYQPSGLSRIVSPTSNARFCAALQAVWHSASPEQTLLDSLLIDFSTRGVVTKDAIAGSPFGSDFQCEAALRLLVYYREIAVPLITRRLDALQVSGIHGRGPNPIMTPDELQRSAKREIANGVDTTQFIRSVAWCDDHRIRRSIDRIAHRSNDDEILDAIRSTKRVRV